MEEEFLDTQDKAKYNYNQVSVSDLPLGKLASKYGLIPDDGFYFKKGYTTFHIFLRLLGNVYFGSTTCRDYFTWKKEKFKFKPFLYRLINFVLLGFFVSYFFVSVTWIAAFFSLAVLTVGINALIWLYLAVVTVKAAIAAKGSNVPVYCCKGCERKKDRHHYGWFWNNNDQNRKCDLDHDKALPMVISFDDVKCGLGK